MDKRWKMIFKVWRFTYDRSRGAYARFAGYMIVRAVLMLGLRDI